MTRNLIGAATGDLTISRQMTICRYSETRRALLDKPASLNYTDDQHNYRDHQQNVNEPS
jgi:hypothetical protein